MSSVYSCSTYAPSNGARVPSNMQPVSDSRFDPVIGPFSSFSGSSAQYVDSCLLGARYSSVTPYVGFLDLRPCPANVFNRNGETF